ncbi:MAG: SufS family cysteine desulfurase [Nitrospinota bacterium]
MNKTETKTELDIERIRGDFPMLSATMHDKPLCYLDNAATTMKPKSVIERVRHFEADEYSTVHRGVYRLGAEATEHFEEARKNMARFIGTDDPKQIIFTSGTTQSINLVAHSYGRKFIKRDDEIIITNIEHHANIVPWQMVCRETGAHLKVVPVNDSGELIMEEYKKLISKKTKLVAVAHVSNALGTVHPVKEIIRLAHDAGALVLIDGAQAAPHHKINVSELDCDFYALSGHKMYGPTGVGVLYGKMEILESMPPYVTGGEMINYVTLEKTEFAKPPARFEAGTPPITQVIGMSEAIDYLTETGLEKINRYEQDLLYYATGLLEGVPGLHIIGTAVHKAGIISFVMDQAHPHDVGTILDTEGIAVRAGHHCAQPTMDRFNVPATTRASFSFYNTFAEIDRLVAAIRKVIEVFG